jgi:hypothetical protein
MCPRPRAPADTPQAGAAEAFAARGARQGPLPSAAPPPDELEELRLIEHRHAEAARLFEL